MTKSISAGALAALCLSVPAGAAERWIDQRHAKVVVAGEEPSFVTDCPAGSSVRAGGYAVENGPPDTRAIQSRPFRTTGWSVTFRASLKPGGTFSAIVWALCSDQPLAPGAAVPPPPPAP